MERHTLPTPVGLYLDLMESVLINSIYQDGAMDPWSPPAYDEQRRDTGPDRP